MAKFTYEDRELGTFEIDAETEADAERIINGAIRGGQTSQALPSTSAQAPTSMQRRMPGVAGAVDYLNQWFTQATPQQRQAVFDFIGQGAGTSAGIAVGTIAPPGAQPVTVPAGGAAGNVLGKMGARAIGPYIGGTGEMPSGGEMAVDAGLGAAGPIVGTLLRSGSRALTGLRQADFRRVQEATNRYMQSGSKTDEAALDAMLTRMGFTTDEIAQAFLTAGKRAAPLGPAEASAEVARTAGTLAGLHRAGTTGETARRGLTAAAAGAVFPMTGEPITSALLSAGLTEALVSRAVPRLLASEKFAEPFARWAFNQAGGRPREAAASLLAIAAKAGLTGDARAAVDELAQAVGTETVAQQRDRLSSPSPAPIPGASLLPLFDDSANRWRHQDGSGRFATAPEEGEQ